MNNNIALDCLPPGLKKLKLKRCNVDDELCNLPISLEVLVIDSRYTHSLSNHPHGLRTLEIHYCECELTNLPSSLLNLVIEYYYKPSQLQNLSPNIQYLSFVTHFYSKVIPGLPTSIRYVKLLDANPEKTNTSKRIPKSILIPKNMRHKWINIDLVCACRRCVLVLVP